MRGSEDGTPGAGEGRGGLTVGFVARAAVAVLVVWALARMLWLGRDLVFAAFFAVLIASFLSIFVAPLDRAGLPRGVAAVAVLVLFVGGLTGLFAVAWPTLQAQLGVIQRQLPEAVMEAGEWLQGQYRAITGRFGRPAAQVEEQVQARVGRELAEMIAGAVPLLNTVVGALLGLFIVVFAGVYLAVEPRTYSRGMTRLLPRTARAEVRDALLAVEDTLRHWMLGTVISMAVIGVLTTLGLWLLGIPAALALGVIAGVLEFIPYFGPFLSGVPAVAVALTISPVTALWVVALYVVIQQLEGNLIYPLIMKGTVRLPPALTILVQSLMAVLFGFLGLLVAVPLLAAVKVLVERLYVPAMNRAGR